MLCQKCGLQEATVHLESVVFRQTIQEHLCRICAGDRAPSEPEQRAPWAARWAGFGGSLEGYIAAIERLPHLSPARERQIFRRIERAELKMRRALGKIPSLGDYLLDVGARLLAGKERVDRVVILATPAARNAYFRALPKLVDATRRCRATAVESWQDCVAGRSRREKKSLQARHGKRVRALSALFPGFRFRFSVYEIYLTRQQPLLKEIASAGEILKAAKKNWGMSDTAGDVAGTQRRMQQIELEQRMPVSALAKAAGEAERHLWAARQTKARLLSANLYRLASIAKRISGTDLPAMSAMMAGICGLMEAVETFDHRRQGKFGPFAARKIRQAIALRSFSKAVYGDNRI